MKLGSLFKILLMLAPLTATNASDQGGQRDLTLYEWAGPYLLFRERDVWQHIPYMQASARDFLWRHWREHRRGFLTVISASDEGFPTTVKYFVEPGKSGQWTIAIEARSESVNQRPDSTADRAVTEDKWIVRSIERMRELPDGRITDEVLRPDAAADPQTYVLILKDKDGKFSLEL